MKTRITELLGIERPIIQGGMQNLGVPALAAAVSNAGGCGTLNRTIYPSNEAMREVIREMKGLTVNQTKVIRTRSRRENFRHSGTKSLADPSGLAAAFCLL